VTICRRVTRSPGARLADLALGGLRAYGAQARDDAQDRRGAQRAQDSHAYRGSLVRGDGYSSAEAARAGVKPPITLLGSARYEGAANRAATSGCL
jgi:hypothetical protein